MYICRDCGRVFDNPAFFFENHGFDYGPAEKWDCCPFCGSVSFDEAVYCDGCHEAVSEEEAVTIRANDRTYHFCEACAREGGYYDDDD